jgi:hypothetical protein
VTLMPGTEAPLASTTRPESVDRNSCAPPIVVRTQIAANRRSEWLDIYAIRNLAKTFWGIITHGGAGIESLR